MRAAAFLYAGSSCKPFKQMRLLDTELHIYVSANTLTSNVWIGLFTTNVFTRLQLFFCTLLILTSEIYIRTAFDRRVLTGASSSVVLTKISVHRPASARSALWSPFFVVNDQNMSNTHQTGHMRHDVFIFLYLVSMIFPIYQKMRFRHLHKASII